jgi:hypothetical protein
MPGERGVRTWHWGAQALELHHDHLLWFETATSVSFAGGGAAEQSLADFRANGPWVEGVPPDVLEEVQALTGGPRATS